MAEEALRGLQGKRRHKGSPGVLHFAGFRYWIVSVLPAIGCIAAACLLGLHLSRLTPGSIFIVYGLATLFAGLLYVAPPVRFSQHAGRETLVTVFGARFSGRVVVPVIIAASSLAAVFR